MSTAAERTRAKGFVQRFGRDAVAWQGLESGCRYWFGDDACVAYVDTGAAWVAAGSPWCEAARVEGVAAAFVVAARTVGKRACFFGVEDRHLWPGMERLLLGQQATFAPGSWEAAVAGHRRLREQLRRARKKGVRVRRAGAADLREGSELRARVDAVADAWLRARRLEPMGFLVSLEPFAFAEAHRYYVAELGDTVVAFTSLVPVPQRGGWLVEDSFRHQSAPNGTAELVLDAVVRDAGGAFVALGLAPLAGPVPSLLRVAGTLARPLYDFRSLEAFRRRLHPGAWEGVWMLYPAGGRARVVFAVVDALRAFAGGSLVAFGWRSFWRRPSVLPWVLAVPLVPWTVVLAVLAVIDDGALMGFSRAALVAWVAWDGVLAVLLFRAARRPTRRKLWALATAAAIDASLSLVHLLRVGLGTTAVAAGLRLAGAVAPVCGALGLAWAAGRAAPAVRRRAP
ncbi:MAG: phosphatidylglycerol lysyltransferase domain-containing protein [Planctomycetota bacterium]